MKRFTLPAIALAVLCCAPCAASAIQFDTHKVAIMAADKFTPAPTRGLIGERVAIAVPTGKYASVTSTPQTSAIVALAGLAAALAALAVAAMLTVRTPSSNVHPVL